MSVSWREELGDLGRMVRTRWARRRLRGAPVRSLTLSLTYRCNARCEMCYCWKKDTRQEKAKELSLEEIDRLAASPYLRKLVALGLTGGETFLYEHLPEVVEVFHRYRPPRYISLATNGFLPERTMETVRDILKRFPTELWVNVSIDALDELHNRIRGVPDCLDKAKETLEGLAGLRERYPHLGVGILFTLQPSNYEQLLPIFRYAREQGVQFNLNPINYGEEYYERDARAVFEQYREILPEIERQFEALDRDCPEDLFGREFRALFRPYVLSGGKPVIPCFAAVANAFINPYGEVFPCVPARRDFLLGSLREESFDRIWEGERARQVREQIRRGTCKCLITCETSTALRYSIPYQAKRIASGLRRFLRGRRRAALMGGPQSGDPSDRGA